MAQATMTAVSRVRPLVRILGRREGAGGSLIARWSVASRLMSDHRHHCNGRGGRLSVVLGDLRV